jgi:hypothetical protein
MKRSHTAALAVAAGALLAGGAVTAGAAGPHVCTGTLHKPGVLKGNYPHGVVVKGACAVKAGKARVIGTVTVTKGSVLAAAYGRHHASLTVIGNLLVDRGATVVLGCKVNPNGSGFACIDDPNPKHPTLTSHATISGNIVARSPLAVIVHNSSIAGNINQSGGGGGLSCAPAKTGPFALFKSPVYSDYEDSSVRGSVTISNVSSCWLGLVRDGIRKSLTVTGNQMGDPDAIEILANHIRNNLACRRNGHPASASPPGDQPVWDSADLPTNPPGVLYPRIAQPNTVGGKRSGQCVLASPATQGGPLGPGPF